jgi:hypothetical protein
MLAARENIAPGFVVSSVQGPLHRKGRKEGRKERKEGRKEMREGGKERKEGRAIKEGKGRKDRRKGKEG